MAHHSAISLQLENLRNLGDEIVKEYSVKENVDKANMINLRRRMASGMMELAGHIEHAIEQLPEDKRPALKSQFRSVLDKARSTAADHQAKWSIVNIDKDPAGYARSAARVADMFGALLFWTSEQLLPALKN
jgi:hypothetical protein